MVLVRSFMSEISPILCLSAALNYASQCPGISHQSTNASPPKIMVKNSDGSSAAALAHRNYDVDVLPGLRTESALWYGALLSILVVVCAQLVVAEHLVCLSNLQSNEPRHTRNMAPRHSSPQCTVREDDVPLGTWRGRSRRRGSCLLSVRYARGCCYAGIPSLPGCSLIASLR